MAIKVISENVIHNGNIYGIDEIINDIDDMNAKRLCKSGLCEMTEDVINEEELHEETKDFEEMSKKELIAYASSIGVEVDERANKATIIETITNADMPATDIPQE